MEESMKSEVDHPSHYTSHPSGVECIEIAELLSFNLGNAFKYLFRRKEKGAFGTDCRKAIWYIERESSRDLNDILPKYKFDQNTDDALSRFLVKICQAETPWMGQAMMQIVFFRTIEDLGHARWCIEQELKMVSGGAGPVPPTAA